MTRVSPNLDRHVVAATLAVAASLAVGAPAGGQKLPADGEGATPRVDASPRHGEWATYDAGGGDEVTAWIVYPERTDAAPVVIPASA